MEPITPLLNAPPLAQPSGTSLNGPELGREVFLRLLVTQLQSQDPTNPVQNEDFVAQLAQFTTLEQTGNTNDLLTRLVDQNTQRSQFELLNMIGREVVAEGNTVSVKADGEVTLPYVLNENAQEVDIDIVNGAGDVVARVEGLGPQAAGRHDAIWNAEDVGGDRVAPGAYAFRVRAHTAEGGPVSVTTFLREMVEKVVLGDDTPSVVLESGTILEASQILAVQ